MYCGIILVNQSLTRSDGFPYIPAKMSDMVEQAEAEKPALVLLKKEDTVFFRCNLHASFPVFLSDKGFRNLFMGSI